MMTRDDRAEKASVDPRIERTRALLVQTAVELLSGKGPEAVTFEAVSRASRVARSTIYRHFADRTQLLAAAVAQVLPPVDTPDASGSTAVQLAAVVGDFACYLRESTMVRVLPVLLELAAQAPELRAAITVPHRRALESVLGRGIEAGDLDARLDLALAQAVLFGPLLFRVLVTGEEVDASTVSSLVGSFLKAHAA
jgi:AcrR family transcriptional regulator